MTVYHGSGDIVESPEIRKSRYTKDFGAGFYCTVIREQAERWAQRMPIPRVNTYNASTARRWLIVGREDARSNNLFFACSLIDNYKGSFYYDSPTAIYDAYTTGELE